MARDFADRAMLRRNKRGALVTKIPATGSSIPGGSPLHKRGRKQLVRAIGEGVPILTRVSDHVALRRATFDEVVRWIHSGDGRIVCSDAMNEDGVTWGTICTIVHEQPTQAAPAPSMKPRLVKDKTPKPTRKKGR